MPVAFLSPGFHVMFDSPQSPGSLSVSSGADADPFIGSSLVSGMFALVLTAPLVGHATWHAYRDLIAD